MIETEKVEEGNSRLFQRLVEARSSRSTGWILVPHLDGEIECRSFGALNATPANPWARISVECGPGNGASWLLGNLEHCYFATRTPDCDDGVVVRITGATSPDDRLGNYELVVDGTYLVHPSAREYLDFVKGAQRAGPGLREHFSRIVKSATDAELATFCRENAEAIAACLP